MDQNAIIRTLNSLYDLAVGGFTGVSGAEEFANGYMKSNAHDIENSIDNLINWQIGQSGLLGFALNVGGLVTLPVTIPADIASSAVIQLRMAAGIAHLRGYDVRSDQVRAFALACLVGNAGLEIIKEAGIQIGLKMTQRMVAQISGQMLTKINQAVGFRLVTKAGQTGIVNITKWIPVVGGLVGGTFDAVTTAGVGRVAKSIFVQIEGNEANIEGEFFDGPEAGAATD